jgi:ribosomal protein S18 acetylase RimI-like enzyme
MRLYAIYCRIVFIKIAGVFEYMKVHVARISDARGIAKLFLQFWEAHRDCKDPQLILRKERTAQEETFSAKKYIRKKDTIFIVAKEGTKILGYLEIIIKKNASIFKIEKYGYFDSIVIDKCYRKKGLGRCLVNEGIKILRKKGISFIKTNVYLTNIAARKFWEKEGFVGTSMIMIKKIE